MSRYPHPHPPLEGEGIQRSRYPQQSLKDLKYKLDSTIAPRWHSGFDLAQVISTGALAAKTKRQTGVLSAAAQLLVFNATRLSGQAWGERADVERHHPAVEIKGATYTALRVARADRGWVAQTVVDV